MLVVGVGAADDAEADVLALEAGHDHAVVAQPELLDAYLTLF